MKPAGILSILAFVLAATTGCASQQTDPVFTGTITDTSYTTTTRDLKSGAIPKKVFEMTRLKHLSITGGDCDYGRVTDDKGNDITQCWDISEIPPEIGNLKELVSLSLPVNAISSLPKEIGRLQYLKSVDLSDNLILVDIDILCDISSLEDLSLCGCNISKLPDRIGNLKHLKSLCLVGTQVGKAELKRIKQLLPNCRISI